MPRSFLVKRVKTESENDISSSQQPDGERPNSIHGSGPQVIKEENERAPKNWYIEYHPALSNLIPAKRCDIVQHHNRGPCYLCSCPFRHIATPGALKGRIKFAPALLPDTRGEDCNNNTCPCAMCQHKVSAQVGCSCASCLRVRHPLLAPGFISHKFPIRKPLCCNELHCDQVPVDVPKYPVFCHCEECLKQRDRLVRESQRAISTPNKTIPGDENREEINDVENDDMRESIEPSEARGGNRMKVRETEEPISRPELSKRKLDEPILEGKKFKREPSFDETTVTEDEKRTPKTKETQTSEKHKENEEEYKSDSDSYEVYPEQCKQEVNGKRNSVERLLLDAERNLESERNGFIDGNEDTKSVTVCEKFEDEGDTAIEIERIPNDLRSIKKYKDTRSRRYNTRHTTTKPRTYDSDYVDTEWKHEKDSYGDVSKTRQKSKLNRLLANEHERRRVAQLNGAYQDLRQLIPGYQCDTKLPKIKILRYAINYIAHLDNILTEGD